MRKNAQQFLPLWLEFLWRLNLFCVVFAFVPIVGCRFPSSSLVRTMGLMSNLSAEITVEFGVMRKFVQLEKNCWIELMANWFPGLLRIVLQINKLYKNVKAKNFWLTIICKVYWVCMEKIKSINVYCMAKWWIFVSLRVQSAEELKVPCLCFQSISIIFQYDWQ